MQEEKIERFMSQKYKKEDDCLVLALMYWKEDENRITFMIQKDESGALNSIREMIADKLIENAEKIRSGELSY